MHLTFISQLRDMIWSQDIADHCKQWARSGSLLSVTNNGRHSSCPYKVVKVSVAKHVSIMIWLLREGSSYVVVESSTVYTRSLASFRYLFFHISHNFHNSRNSHSLCNSHNSRNSHNSHLLLNSSYHQNPATLSSYNSHLSRQYYKVC